MRYFEALEKIEDIKARYKELAKLYHPDLGGDVEIMKAVNSEYEKILIGGYQKEGKSITEIDELLVKDAEVRRKLNEIILLNGLKVELCGCWLWVSGETKAHKDKLKEALFRWSPNKLAWYWREEETRSFNRKPMDLDTIRMKWGSSSVKAKQYNYIGV